MEGPKEVNWRSWFWKGHRDFLSQTCLGLWEEQGRAEIKHVAFRTYFWISAWTTLLVKVAQGWSSTTFLAMGKAGRAEKTPLGAPSHPIQLGT